MIDPNDTWSGQLLELYQDIPEVRAATEAAGPIFRTELSPAVPEVVKLVLQAAAEDECLCRSIGQSITHDYPLTTGTVLHKFIKEWRYRESIRRARKLINQGVTLDEKREA